MSGTRQYRQLSAETLDTLLRLITEDKLTPKQIAERTGAAIFRGQFRLFSENHKLNFAIYLCLPA